MNVRHKPYNTLSIERQFHNLAVDLFEQGFSLNDIIAGIAAFLANVPTVRRAALATIENTWRSNDFDKQHRALCDYKYDPDSDNYT